MTDERGRDAADRDGDADGERKMDAPGGGPQRVVSERSVDDILEALDDGPGTARASESVPDADGRGDDRRDDGSNADGPDDRRDEPTGGTHSPSTSEPSTAEPSPPERRSSTAASVSQAPIEDRRTGVSTDDAGPEPEADADGRTALSYRDDEALAGRVAANEVTGADVRAAESGSGREAMPAIDDVDLSTDDLEDAAIGGTATTNDPAPDSNGDSPGSADDSTGGDDLVEARSTDDSTDSGGVLGLVRRLIPW